jgi:hypothetical protein
VGDLATDPRWHVVYNLTQDLDHIRRVQHATLSTDQFGILPTHGLVGSDEWWQRIESRELPIHAVSGVIDRVYMTGHNDFPQFDPLTREGDKSSWERLCNDRCDDSLYVAGAAIEVDYVLQQWKRPVPVLGTTTRLVVAIRIEASRV